MEIYIQNNKTADHIVRIINESEKELKAEFEKIDNIALINQTKVLNAFKEVNIGLRHFAGTTGYGYDDIGRDALCQVYAKVLGAESTIVSPHMFSGTHALTIGLFGILRPGDTMLSITGELYDTMRDVVSGNGNGSLKDFGIHYGQLELKNGKIDEDKLMMYLTERKPKLIYIQRSRGYEWRSALQISEIKQVIEKIRYMSASTCVYIDNCYGEFVDYLEPTDVGADVVVGSLIKNIGGGIAPSGGYIAGKKKYIDLIAGRFSAPSVGAEIGSYVGGYQYFYQGLFVAPHTTAQAVKGAKLFSKVFEKLGYKTLPHAEDKFGDIICSIEFDTEDELVEFCRKIQACSPIDSNVVPYPWDMPGYQNQVIMAAGCFVQGASIELSADSPIQKPYIAYLQGGLTYEHVKLAVIQCAAAIAEKKNFNENV